MRRNFNPKETPMVADLQDADWQKGVDVLNLNDHLRSKLRAAISAFKHKREFPQATVDEFEAITETILMVRFKPSGTTCILEYSKKRLYLRQENTKD